MNLRSVEKREVGRQAGHDFQPMKRSRSGPQGQFWRTYAL